MPTPRVLILDHEDSFIYNLVHLVQTHAAQVQVVRTAVWSRQWLAHPWTHVVLSPGPGHPQEAQAFLDLLQHIDKNIPVLGVCLGHQAMAYATGCRVVRAATPCHGEASLITHTAQGIFSSLPSATEVGRYHSLVVQDDAALQQQWQVTARLLPPQESIMAMQHRQHPWFGVQFHPESLLTPLGGRWVANFLHQTHTQ